jgi:ABC-type polar amino acid transport system ATPase subunit
MPRASIIKTTDVIRTPRVMQMESIFDVPPSERSQEHWDVNFDLPEQWNVGLIVGPSGSGKTTIAKEFFGGNLVSGYIWEEGKSILDAFPKTMSIKEIVDLLSSVGFSSPPSWVRPFNVLSTGEQFRVTMARALAENNELSVIDEFTSVVDRTVACIGSSAIQKSVRRRNQKLIAVSCHYDIIDWLEPDWIYQPAINDFHCGRSLHQRPKIEFEIKRVHKDAWQLFKNHHYLSGSLNDSAKCFCAFLNGEPIAFQAWLHMPHPVRKNIKRITRTVVLPDYQGIGIGMGLTNALASCVKGMGFDPITTTAHPGRIYALNRDKHWQMNRQPSRTSDGGNSPSASMAKTYSFKRMTASFHYVGEAMQYAEAIQLWEL